MLSSATELHGRLGGVEVVVEGEWSEGNGYRTVQVMVGQNNQTATAILGSFLSRVIWATNSESIACGMRLQCGCKMNERG